MEIAQNFYNAYYTPKSFFAEKDFDGWDPKIYSLRNYLQSFCVASLIDECGTIKHYPLAMFRNVISIKTRLSVIGKMDDGIPLPSSDSAMRSKRNKISVPRLNSKWRSIVYPLKQRMMHCLRIAEKTCLCTKAIKCHAKKCTGEIISPVTWVWNGARWSSWWLKLFWNSIL